jgi:hypothetical protein
MIYCCLVYAYLCEYNFPLWNQNKVSVPTACEVSSKRRGEINWALMRAFSKVDPFCDCQVHNCKDGFAGVTLASAYFSSMEKKREGSGYGRGNLQRH